MPSPADAATLQALLDGVQAARRDAEAEWGADRLVRLVGDDLRGKLYRQQAKWSAAYQAAWEAPLLSRDLLDAVTSAAGGMTRAWPALAAAAVEAGHRPLHPDVWEVRLADGSVAALVRDNDAARHVLAEGRGISVYTVAEIANVIDALPDALKLAKIHYPGAEFQPPRDREPTDRSWVRHGDEIPFGDEVAA